MNDSVWIRFYEQGVFKEELTFSRADELIQLKAKQLVKNGIKAGDRIVVKLVNSPLAVITYFALYHLKAIVVPVHFKESDDRLNFIINNCGARAVISSDEVQILNFNNTSESSLEKISTIIYTSGTTGDPKGVCLGWNNWIANTQSLIRHHNLNSETIFASPLLLSHCNAHGLAMISTYNARCKWILFDKVTPNFLNIVSKEKVNILSIVPAILYQLFAENKDWKPHSELKYILTAAATLSSSLLESVRNNWKVLVIQGYGLSESTNFSCTIPVDISEETYNRVMYPFPSIGVPLDHVDIRIGEKDEENVVGELFIKSPSNFNGYWKKDALDQKEWVDTGDLGYYKTIDSRRFYYLNGRIKEIINRGGEKISPVELESEICKIGINCEFAVISIPDEKYGEEVGLVCCQPFDYKLLEKVPVYRKPKKVFLLESLFYTPTGKLQRRKLADYCNNGNAKVLFDDFK